MNLGDEIRKARETKKLSQESLAQQVGITVSTMYKIEKNKVNPSFKIVTKLAEILGISLDSLR